MAKKTNSLATRDGGIDAFMTSLAPRLEEVATQHLTPERMLKIFAAAARTDDTLLACTVESLASSLLLASQLGLEPCSPLGHLYLVPYGKKCTPIIGYKGMLELIRRTGEVKRTNAQVFYRQEVNDGAVEISLEPPSVVHRWTGAEYSDKDIAGAYCMIEGMDGQTYLATVTRAEIEDRRRRSAAGNSGPWKTDFAAMARKCAIRKLFSGGTVPISVERLGFISAAIQAEEPPIRTTKAMRRVQAFTMPETPAVDYWGDAQQLAMEMGCTEDEIKQATADVGLDTLPPEDWKEQHFDVFIGRLEIMKGM